MIEVKYEYIEIEKLKGILNDFLERHKNASLTRPTRIVISKDRSCIGPDDADFMLRVARSIRSKCVLDDYGWSVEENHGYRWVAAEGFNSTNGRGIPYRDGCISWGCTHFRLTFSHYTDLRKKKFFKTYNTNNPMTFDFTILEDYPENSDQEKEQIDLLTLTDEKSLYRQAYDKENYGHTYHSYSSVEIFAYIKGLKLKNSKETLDTLGKIALSHGGYRLESLATGSGDPFSRLQFDAGNNETYLGISKEFKKYQCKDLEKLLEDEYQNCLDAFCEIADRFNLYSNKIEKPSKK